MSASDFRDTLLELIDESPEPVGHPSADRWLAYQRGELPANEEARLQEHLVRCRDRFDLAEGAAAFAAPDMAPEEIAAGPRRRPPRRFSLPTALAASFFVALVGLSVWSLHQRSLLEALRAPRPDVRFLELAGGERSTPAAAEKILVTSTGPWVLVFHPADELPVYRLTLRDAVTGEALGSYELRPDQDLALTLQLPEGLRPGRYRLELADGSGGERGRSWRRTVCA